MRRVFLAVLLPAALFAQTEYRGRLDDQLAPPPQSHMLSDLKLATVDQKSLMEAETRDGDRLFFGQVAGCGAIIDLMLRERDGAMTLFADVDGNHRFTAAERQRMDPSPDTLQAGTVTVELPLAASPIAQCPLKVYLYQPQARDKRTVGVSPRAFAHGMVEIAGKPRPFQLEFDAKRKNAYADFGLQGLDTNGDGEIDTAPESDEFTRAKDERVVFHVDDEFVSIKHVDLAEREVIFERRDSGDYARIDLKPGIMVPDFEFTDFDGRSHRLSDYQGTPVLLDFWATWCAPCMAEVPQLRELHLRHNSKGLILIGMNADKEDPGRAKAVIQEKMMDWPHATYASIKAIMEQRFRINAFPTHIVLDGDRRIVAVADGSSESLQRWVEQALAVKRGAAPQVIIPGRR